MHPLRLVSQGNLDLTNRPFTGHPRAVTGAEMIRGGSLPAKEKPVRNWLRQYRSLMKLPRDTG
tara:strand:- start:88 stop:276 length:189 start_codon:yes stop_codon:yes gene_type:complete